MEPLAIALLLLFVAIVAVLGWVVFRTAQSLAVHGAGRQWRIAFVLMGATGLAFGSWCALYAKYQTDECTRYIGAPVPTLVLILEDGRWVDYISPASPLIALLDLLAVCFCFVMPVSIGYKLSRWTKRSGLQQ
jgi:hypothetical protein